MKLSLNSTTLFITLSIALSSCELHCSVGNSDETKIGKPRLKDGATIYNDIVVNSNGVELKKAYLMLEEGGRVSEGNFVDFPVAVKLILQLGEGWSQENGRVFLGVSERILDESNNVVLEENDLFADNAEGLTIEDSKAIGITARLRLKENAPPTSFRIYFRVWDKNGEGAISGNYTIFSK